MQRLSSGLRVNSAKDDAAGLAIAERMNAQVRGMNGRDPQRQRRHLAGPDRRGRAGQGRRLAAAHARTGGAGRQRHQLRQRPDSLNKEFGELAKEIQRVLGGTKFNGLAILGSDAGTQTFQVGAGTGSNDRSTSPPPIMTTAPITAVAVTDTPAAAAHRHRLGRLAGDLHVIDNIDTAIWTRSTASAPRSARRSRASNR
jgi:flagellin